jgi:hypothetical protein
LGMAQGVVIDLLRRLQPLHILGDAEQLHGRDVRIHDGAGLGPNLDGR